MLRDYTHVESTQRALNKYAPKLKEMIQGLGGVVKDSFFPMDLKAEHDIVVAGFNRWNKEYFGVDSMEEAIQHVIDDTWKQFPKETHEFYNNLKSWMSRTKSSNELGITNRMGKQLDPASALFVILDSCITLDSEVYNYDTVSKEWLEHNYGYLAKVGYSSQYYYPLLELAEEGYRRQEEVEYTDDQLFIVAKIAVFLQQLVPKGTLKPIDLDVVHAEALSNNNKAAEGVPGMGNIKNKETEDRALARSKAMQFQDLSNDVFGMVRQHRIQSGGNVVMKYLGLVLDESTGLPYYTKDMLVSAFRNIKSDRGSFASYTEKEPDVILEIADLISYEKLPDSEELRKALVASGQADEIILKQYKGTFDWMYNYIVNCPNVFTLIGDKYPGMFPDLSDKIFTKHRGIKASGVDFSRLGQMYLYPLMDWQRDNLVNTPFESFVAQWMHPDFLSKLMTNLAVMVTPDLLLGVVDHSLNEKELQNFQDLLKEVKMILDQSSDDKDGFDMFLFIITSWLYWTTYFSVAFEDNEENNNMFKAFVRQSLFAYIITPDGIEVYDNIIASGAFYTSHLGTYNSNKSGLNVQANILFAIPGEVDEQSDDEIEEVTSDGPEDTQEDDEEVE